MTDENTSPHNRPISRKDFLSKLGKGIAAIALQGMPASDLFAQQEISGITLDSATAVQLMLNKTAQAIFKQSGPMDKFRDLIDAPGWPVGDDTVAAHVSKNIKKELAVLPSQIKVGDLLPAYKKAMSNLLYKRMAEIASKNDYTLPDDSIVWDTKLNHAFSNMIPAISRDDHKIPKEKLDALPQLDIVNIIHLLGNKTEKPLDITMADIDQARQDIQNQSASK